MKIDSLIPPHELRDALDGKLVRQQFHPERPELTILNYTDKAQVNNVWNRATKTCRGLIFDSETGDIVARPFPKFFNYGQEPKAFRRWSEDEMVVVTDQLDGSLGISYMAPDGQLAIATRGSFTSEQALHATDVLRTRYSGFEPLPGKTYLFEIIYPENRIVVNYGDTNDLVLIGVVDIESGLSFTPVRDSAYGNHFRWPGPIVQIAPYKRFRDALVAPPRPNAEGLVVHFLDTDERVKIKQDDYVALHKIVTGLNEVVVWEALKLGGAYEDLLHRLPDEFHAWVQKTSTRLVEEFIRLNTEVEATFAALEVADVVDDRKAFALSIKDKPAWLKACLFAWLDGNHHRANEVIWKFIKPKGDK
ncbi:RNA ligase [Amycolatopsis sp.]|uniref:RNA ligase n=1 Tax=Amycolatopsis sp. TaxID=37632 RepID=UPI002BBC128E|nr:RNA ligase [Amycolatopsis sp.]HVV11624.1 RNA ligase [Amycolatopsis sp.]